MNVTTFSALETKLSDVVSSVLPPESNGSIVSRLRELLPSHVKLVCGICTNEQIFLKLDCEIIQESNKQKIVCNLSIIIQHV